MERKRIIEISLAIGVLIALGLVVAFMLKDSAATPVREEVKKENLPSSQGNKNQNTTINPADVPKPQVVSANTVARTFVERIGSYSSQSNFQNVDDVSSLVTEKLNATLQQSAKKSREEEPEGDGYYGVSTAFLGTKTISESSTGITLMVQTQREEAFGSPANEEIRYQSIEVTLVKEGDAWKVDAFTWQD